MEQRISETIRRTSARTLFPIAALICSACTTVSILPDITHEVAGGCGLTALNTTVLIPQCIENRKIAAEYDLAFERRQAELERQLKLVKQICALSLSKPEFKPQCVAATTHLSSDVMVDEATWRKNIDVLRSTKNGATAIP